MHRCLKCGRSVASVNEIQEGCPCGSKVFVFHRLPIQGEEMAPLSTPHITLIPAIGDDAVRAKSGGSGSPAASPPPSSPVPAIFSSGGASANPAPKSSGPSPSQLSSPSSQLSSPPSPASSPISSPPSQASSPSKIQNLAAVNPPAVASSIISSDAEEGADTDAPYSEVWLTKGGRIEPLESGAVPITSAQDISMTLPPAPPDVANVRQLKRGVYEIDVGRLQGEPLVVQDSEGIYYVRLPFAPLPTELPEKKE